MNFWCKNEQAACGSALQMVVFTVKTLQVVHLAHNLSPFFGIIVIKFNCLGCGVGGVSINDRWI